jgi:hypothetical protein
MTSKRPTVLEDLVLCRLSVGATAPPLTRVHSSLFAFGHARASMAEWRTLVDAAIESLRASGLVDAKKLRPTAAGKDRLRAILQEKRLPEIKSWAIFQRDYLVRLAPASTGDPRTTDPVLSLLAKTLDVKGPVSTATQLADRWIASSLGLKAETLTLNALRAALIAEPLGVRRDLSFEQTIRIAAAKHSGAPKGTKSDVLIALVGQRLTDEADASRSQGRALPSDGAKQAPPRAERATDIATKDFVTRVLGAARSRDAHSFGPSKVFIGSVWRLLQSDPAIGRLGEEGFKRALVQAHRSGALTLSRADLVSAMDPIDVTTSEITDLNATFHFIHANRE